MVDDGHFDGDGHDALGVTRPLCLSSDMLLFVTVRLELLKL